MLEALAASQPGLAFEFTSYGRAATLVPRPWREMMPADGLAQLRDKDAILFGSAGDPHPPTTSRAVVRRGAGGLTIFANVRPPASCPALMPPSSAARPRPSSGSSCENSEGEYAGVGGRVHQGHPIEVATDLTRDDPRRGGAHHALCLPPGAVAPRKLLTVITKSNAQRHAMVMWDEIALQISQEFPDVKWDKELVDAATARMVNRPATLDTIVATNLHADILERPGRRAGGQPGHCAHRQHRPRAPLPQHVRAHPRLWPSTSWARAWPTRGHVWSCVMLLELKMGGTPLQTPDETIEQVTADAALRTGDLGNKATTGQVARAYCEERLATAACSSCGVVSPLSTEARGRVPFWERYWRQSHDDVSNPPSAMLRRGERCPAVRWLPRP